MDHLTPAPSERYLADGRRVALEREEHEACDASTPGCCIDHTNSRGRFRDQCETW